MKRRGCLFVAVVLVTVSIAIAGCEKSQSTNERKSSSEGKAAIQIPLAGYNFPLTVDQVVKKMGNPTRTYIDKNETCPVGQLHYWNIADNNTIFLVVGDNYDEKVDYLSSSRLFGLSKLIQDRPSSFESLFEIRLDDSADEVKRKIESFVAKNPVFRISQNNNAFSPLRFFCEPDKFKLQYVLRSGDTYLYFIINKKNTLEAIVKASFDVLAAC